MPKKERRYRLINKTPLPDESRLIGYCWCDVHQGFLTKNLLEEHECLKKHCSFLERFPKHPYWTQKETTKQKRADAKSAKATEALILERFRELTADYDDFAVCAVNFKDDAFCVRCVTIQSHELSEIRDQIAQEFHVCIKIIYIQNTYEMRKELIAAIKGRKNDA